MEFPDGVIGIMGPNGAGKSTLIEAISWALYGNRSESRNGREGIKRTGAGPHEDCWVELEFELGQVQYRLRRSLRGKDLKAEAELSAGGGMIARSERAVTQKVESILGMDYQAFFVSVFARQKDLSALSVLTPGERKKLVMRMLELDVLQDVVDQVRRDGKEERSVLDSLREQLLTSDRRNRREVLEEEIVKLAGDILAFQDALQGANQALVARQEELEAALARKDWATLKEGEYRKVERRVVERGKEAEEARRSAGQVSQDMARLRERLTSLLELEAQEKEMEDASARKEVLELDMTRFEQRRGAAKNLNRVRDEIGVNAEDLAKAKEELGRYTGSEESLTAVTTNLEGLECDTGEKRERLKVVESEIRRLTAEREDIAARTADVSRLGPESMCPTCERQLGEQHHHLLSKLDAQSGHLSATIEVLKAERDGLKESLEVERRRKEVLEKRKVKLAEDVGKVHRFTATVEGLEGRESRLQGELTTAQAALDNIGEVVFDQEAYAKVKATIASLRPYADRCKSLRGEAAHLPELEERSAAASRAVATKEEEFRKAHEDLAAVGYQDGDLKAARESYDAAFHARETAITDVSHRATDLELATARSTDKQAALDEVKGQEQTLALRTTTLERLVTLEKVMADFKQHVTDRVLPTLSEVSSQFFVDMTDSRYGGIELDEDYEMQVYDGTAKYPLSRFSGGEADLANLSLRLAISRVLADRSGNDINFLILDEIFGSQDHTRKRNIMATLNRLEKQFHQIILITHIDDTKDLMTNVITIKELDDGTSAIEY